MNRYALPCAVVWKTSVSSKQKIAELLCKNFGLSMLQKNTYAGLLYKKEKDQLYGSLLALFSGKRDQVHIFTMCQSCVSNVMSKDPKPFADAPIPYEFV